MDNVGIGIFVDGNAGGGVGDIDDGDAIFDAAICYRFVDLLGDVDKVISFFCGERDDFHFFIRIIFTSL